jgi:hypothetical protein
MTYITSPIIGCSAFFRAEGPGRGKPCHDARSSTRVARSSVVATLAVARLLRTQSGGLCGQAQRKKMNCIPHHLLY